MEPRIFTITLDAGARHVLTPVHIGRAYDPEAPPVPAPKLREFKALWDTGATTSVITQSAVDKCGLKPTGMTKIEVGDGRECVCETFLVTVQLPNDVIFYDVNVIKANAAAADFVIGMDIILSGDLSLVNKDGKRVFTFRCPTADHFDTATQIDTAAIINRAAKRLEQHRPFDPFPLPPFAKRAEQKPTDPFASIRTPKNAPCPCRSGKKYKNCCGVKSQIMPKA